MIHLVTKQCVSRDVTLRRAILRVRNYGIFCWVLRCIRSRASETRILKIGGGLPSLFLTCELITVESTTYPFDPAYSAGCAPSPFHAMSNTSGYSRRFPVCSCSAPTGQDETPSQVTHVADEQQAIPPGGEVCAKADPVSIPYPYRSVRTDQDGFHAPVFRKYHCTPSKLCDFSIVLLIILGCNAF